MKLVYVTKGGGHDDEATLDADGSISCSRVTSHLVLESKRSSVVMVTTDASKTTGASENYRNDD